ncbi:MAG: NAD-dependent epimerase/dehydratase [Actinomycetia bacterium]|jgi:uncharacterized protein YbjT (DUF2867 family)|nr:NAD-dependent epimerase/dehydratase [Actinomycetes bacterium]
MRLFVTGGSGFTGRRVVAHALAAGHDVVALARSDAAAGVLRDLGARIAAGDLDDAGSLPGVFAAAHADCLLNVASMGFGHGPAVVSAAEQAGIRRGVFVSTTAVTTRLPAASRRVRLAAEDAITTSGLTWTILRPTMIYGQPGDRNISRLLALLRRAPAVPVPGGGHRLQQPVHVDDLAAAIVAAAEQPTAAGRIFDIAGPEPISFRRSLREAGDAVGRRPWLVPVPLGPCVLGLRLYERAASRPRLRAEQLERLAEDKSFDIGAARAHLGFDPRPFRVGVREEARLLWP